MGLFGPPNIEKMQAKRDFQGLEQALVYQKDKAVRFSAAEALGSLGDSRSVEPLIEALNDCDQEVCQAAATALGRIGGSHAASLLIDVLCNSALVNRDLHDSAAASLIKIGGPAADLLIGTIRYALRTGDTGRRRTAAEALGKFGHFQQVDGFIDELIATLKDGKQVVRLEAAETLGEMGDARAVHALINALPYTDEKMRLVATKALGKLNSQAVEPLIAALQHSHAYARQGAVEALGKNGDERAVGPLIVAFQEGNLRWQAIESLSQIGPRLQDTALLERLIETLSQGIHLAPRAVIEGLGKIAKRQEDPALHARAVEPLITALGDGDESVCRTAAEALEKIGWQPEKDENGARYYLAKGQWEHCVEIGGPAVEPLVILLKRGGRERQYAANALVKLGEPAMEPLIAALKDDDRGVGQAVTEILDNLGWQPGKDENGARYYLARGQWEQCIEIGEPAIDPLINLLKKGGNEIQAASQALVKFGEPAVEPLIAVLIEHYGEVGQAAAKALAGLGWQPAKDENGARYHLAMGQWDDCVEIGGPAIEPLIFYLELDKGRSERQAVAEALVRIYHVGDLEPANKARILSLRARIIETHSDFFGQCDRESNTTPHGDRGIGVDFPL
jgi:HEAT repeat protein